MRNLFAILCAAALVGLTLAACPSNCKTCDNEGVCSECNDEYYLDSTNNECKSCTLTHCKTCADDVCSACVEPYTLDGDVCKKACPSNCKTCDNEGVCSECNDEHYLDSTNNECKSCTDPHCKTCADDECSECNENYHLETGVCVSDVSCTAANCAECEADGTTCKTCSGEFKKNQYGECLCTVEHCTNCTVAGVCDDCVGDYELSEGVCVPKAATCTAANCATCNEADPSKCDVCSETFFKNAEGVCACTVEHCTACTTDAGVCDGCVEGFTPDENGACVETVVVVCQPGEYKDGETCKKCNKDLHCQTCSNGESCDTCEENYVKNDEKHTCELKKDSEGEGEGGSNAGMIAGIVVGCIVLLVIVGAAVWCFATAGRKHGKIDSAFYEEDVEFASMSVL